MGHLDPGSKAYSHTTTNPSSKYFPRLYPTQNYAQTKLYVPTAPSKPKRKQTRYCNIQHPNTTCFFWQHQKILFTCFGKILTFSNNICVRVSVDLEGHWCRLFGSQIHGGNKALHGTGGVTCLGRGIFCEVDWG